MWRGPSPADIGATGSFGLKAACTAAGVAAVGALAASRKRVARAAQDAAGAGEVEEIEISTGIVRRCKKGPIQNVLEFLFDSCIF